MSSPPLLVVSTGCPAGIGPEIAVAAAAKLKDIATVLVGDEHTLRQAAELVGVAQRRLQRWDGRSREASRVYVAQVGDPLTSADRTPGKPNAGAGRAQLEYIEAAFTLVKSSERAALVTSIGVGSTAVDTGVGGLQNVSGAFNAALVGGGVELFEFVSAQLLVNLSSFLREGEESNLALAIGFDAVQFARFTDRAVPRLLKKNELVAPDGTVPREP